MNVQRIGLSKIVRVSVCLILLAFTLTGSVYAQDTGEGQWTAYIIENEARDQRVDQIAVAGDGTVWVTTRSDGMGYFDGVSWHTLHDVSEAMLPDLFFFGGFTAAQDGTVWLSDLYVLGRYADEAWTLYRSPDSLEAYGTYFMENTIQQYNAPVLVTEEVLPLDRVTDLATDSNGILWIATSEGVLRFDGQNWVIDRDELISKSILVLTIAPDDSVWVGGQRGLSHFDGRQWTNYPQAKGLLSTYLDMLAVDAGGYVWGTTNGGVFWFDGERWDIASELEELNVGIVWSLAAGPDGAIWVGSENGLSHFDGSHWSHYPLDKMLLSASGEVNAEGIMALVVAPDGTVWCGTQRGVVSFRISETDFTEANRDG